ncbi:DNA polymerase III subunit beta [Nocardiopsis sp. HNM0947]|uniref:DNA polymerase III subunit beta n=1 Tax=Nocardiopsis coralli TaxID=2772213 RepID=A0ABR9P061_9ACTN|nr:DNA polymerase III subunit beta [Nocardiopsis coralli]MBE2997170.1 DNA polymerase III subunit beta [Nocardiopsis coralli]
MTEVLERTHNTTDHPTAAMAAFTLTRAELVEALSTVGAAVPKRPAVPCMAGVLLESNGPDLWVSGYDYATSVTVRIPDAVDSPGRVLVSHSELSKLLKALVKGLGKRAADGLPVTVRNEDDQYAAVELAGSTIPMELFPVDDYPSLPATPPAFASIDGAQFAHETRRVLRAASGDDTLPMLTGMKIDITQGGLKFAATDRYRLAVGHVPGKIHTDTAPESGALIDGASLGTLLPQLRGTHVRVGYGSGKAGDLVSLESGPVTIITRLHNGGEFVKYSDHLPTEAPTTVTVDRAELLTQIQRAAAVLSAKGHKAHPVTLAVDTNTVSVAPHLGCEAHQVRTREMPATVTGPGAVTIAVNPKFFTDAVESFRGDTLTLHIRAYDKPVLITDTPDGLSDHAEFRHLVMPQRIST